MGHVDTSKLRQVIQAQYGVASDFVKSVRVRAAGDKADWDGLVHVFDLKDHPSARSAFAWSSRFAGGSQPRYFAVLRGGQINTPTQAVKAASAAIRKWGAKGTGP